MPDHTDLQGSPDPAANLHQNLNPYDLQRLIDKTAIVTGSTRGIGEAIAKRVASEGASTIVSGRSIDSGESVVEDIQTANNEAKFVSADMGNLNDIERLIEKTVDQYGSIDILINNAATWTNGPFTEITPGDWENVLNVNLRAPWHAARLAMEDMPPGSSIINISSVHAHVTDPERFPYNVSKAGLNGLTRSLAHDLSPLDIRVNTIAPGDIVTGQRDNDTLKRHSNYVRLAPSNRVGVPEDIASMTAHLASDESTFINGETITIDGGYTTRYPNEG